MFLGNSDIKDYFEKIIKANTLSHAYLFYGPEGVGKKSLVFEISEAAAGPTVNNPDLRIIDKGSEEIHIADIRELKNFIHLTSFGKYKIAVINNAHNLGRDASNALLKILEEPPGNSVLFLISHLPELLLATVVSRCQEWRFKPLKEKEIANYLINENKIKKEVAVTAAGLAGGSLGLALELADNFDKFQKNINLLNKLSKASFMERFEAAKKISGDSESLRKLVADWLIYSASLIDKRAARELLYLNNILAKPQFNHRLAFEGFLTRL